MFKKNVISSIVIVLILCSLFIAFYTRQSFIDNTNYNESDINNFAVQINTNDFGWYNREIKTIDDLKQDSCLVVKVKTLDERKIKYKTMLSKVKILEVYKGDKNLVNEEVEVYEAVFPEQRSNNLISYNGCIPMVNDNEYILFLKSPIPSEGYNEKEYMYTSDKFAKYSLKENDCFIYNKDIKFNEVSSYNIILSDEIDIEIYKSIKDEVLKEFA